MARKALEAFPEDASLAKALGIICYRRGDYRRTVQLLDLKTREDQTDAELFYYLGMAHYQLKERRQSKAALQRALGLKLDKQLASEATRVLSTID
jgi:Flp pilus assembly protein TadD